MNPPNEAATTDNTNRAATSNNGGAVPTATFQAPPSPSVTATILAGTPPAMSERPPDNTDDGNESNSLELKIPDDRKKPAPSVGMAKSTLYPNSLVAGIGQDSHGDNGEPPPTAMPRNGVEIVDDKDGPPILPAMSAPYFATTRTAASRYAGKKAKDGPEIIQDNTGPPLAITEIPDSKKMEPILARPPRFINIAEIDDEEDALEKGQPPRQKIVRDDSLDIPTSYDMDDDDLRIHTNRGGRRAEEFIANANVAPSNPGVHKDEDEEANIRHSNPEDMTARPDLERNSTYRVPEAVLVEGVDDEVYVGTPIEPHVPPLPWWKQRRMRFLLSLMFVFVAISATIIGALLSSEGTVVDPVVIVVVASAAPSSSTAPSSFPTNKPSNAPSTTAFPSISPSTSPSSSMAPSSSISPTPIPSSSMAPSSSIYPTSCNLITIAIDYDEKPEETTFYLTNLFDSTLVKDYRASEDDTSHSESFCLEAGEYQFSMYDRTHDGLCCDHGEGNYNVTVNGALIVEGGEFTRVEWTDFSLPFVLGTNRTTQNN